MNYELLISNYLVNNIVNYGYIGDLSIPPT